MFLVGLLASNTILDPSAVFQSSSLRYVVSSNWQKTLLVYASTGGWIGKDAWPVSCRKRLFSKLRASNSSNAYSTYHLLVSYTSRLYPRFPHAIHSISFPMSRRSKQINKPADTTTSSSPELTGLLPLRRSTPRCPSECRSRQACRVLWLDLLARRGMF
jgi:hypothetical protein